MLRESEREVVARSCESYVYVNNGWERVEVREQAVPENFEEARLELVVTSAVCERVVLLVEMIKVVENSRVTAPREMKELVS